ARAVRDDRAAQAGANAAALARSFDVGNDLIPIGDAQGNLVGYDPGSPRLQLAATPNGFAAPDPAGPGSPVYVDPWYYALGAGPLGQPQGVTPPVTPGVTRATCSYAAGAGKAQFFTLLDEMNFQPSGRPVNEGGAFSLERP